jgi:O-antigen biosynthesis protein
MSASEKTERFIPGEGDRQTALEHTLRYEFASSACKDLVVVDLACGDGYGAAILATVASSVMAIDIDEPTIRAARRRYADRRNIEFRTGDAHAINLPDASVDCVIAFEMIEHVEQPAKVIREVRRVLRPGGRLIVSTPNAPENPENLPGANPFHLHAFDERSFDSLLAAGFEHRSYFGERVVAAGALWPLAATSSEDGAPDTTGQKLSTLGATYLVAVASTGDAPPPSGGLRWQLDETGGLIEERTEFWKQAREAYERERELAEKLEVMRSDYEQLDDRIREAGRAAISAQSEVAERRSEVAHLRSELETVRAETNTERQQADYFRDESIRLREALDSVMHSASWQITKPLRRLRGSDRPD